MEPEERAALEGYSGLLDVRRERLNDANTGIVNPRGGWQKLNRWLCATNGGYVVRVTYPDLNPGFGHSEKSLYFNPNTRVWIGGGGRQ